MRLKLLYTKYMYFMLWQQVIIQARVSSKLDDIFLSQFVITVTMANKIFIVGFYEHTILIQSKYVKLNPMLKNGIKW